MKSDLDALMQSHNLDALLVIGSGQHNPPMVYLTGGAHLNGAYLVKKRGEPPMLFSSPIEREEAARTGLETRDLGKYNLEQLLRQADGDWVRASVVRLQQIFQEIGLISGRVAIYGHDDVGSAFAVFTALQAAMPSLTVVGELMDTLFLEAMSTKSPDEIERIRRIGQITTAVVGQVANFLTSHRTRDQVLVKSDGAPLTVGEVKNQVRLWLAERGAESSEGPIFAIGRDAAVPHSMGQSADLLRLGQTIIFDIYPCEMGGGYFYDMTRTWCLGYATDQALSLYEDVLAVYRQLTSELRLEAACSLYQQRACELFSARGHPTIKENPQTLEGYVHGLGHGVGLFVHELPYFRMHFDARECLKANVVVTVEPGLYYPERGMGVRLEDTIWMRPDGKAEVLDDYPLDLVLPMRG